MTTYIPLLNNKTNYIILNNKLIYFFLFIIITLQIACLIYMIILTNIATNINLFDFNKTETTEYINKFKIIIDDVCSNVIKC